MAENALTAVIQGEADRKTIQWVVFPPNVIQGISTRSVDDLVKSLGVSGVSKSRACSPSSYRTCPFEGATIAQRAPNAPDYVEAPCSAG
jgi:hypothetical protein